MYFDGEQVFRGLSGRNRESAIGLDALVVTAGFLDEPLLGMSSEPLVYGALVPRIHALLFRKGLWKAPASRSGLRVGLGWEAMRWILSFARTVFGIIGAPVILPCKKLLENYLKGTFLKVVSSAALGIHPVEFASARISVSTRPQIPPLIREHVWDVARLLTAYPRHFDQDRREQPNWQEADDRYAFLWARDQASTRAERSWLWQNVASSLKELQRRYRPYVDATPDALSTDLYLVTLTLEERLKEIFGLVPLMHSQYYSNPVIMHAVAEFLAHGALPAEVLTQAEKNTGSPMKNTVKV